MIDSIDAACLERLRAAVAVARARAWKLGARPAQTILDVDATLTAAHSDKEQAKGNFKGGYGHHPLLCYLDGTGEGMAGVLRPGNAGSNTAADHTAVLELALEQLDPVALEGEILVRADGAGSSHELTGFCRDGAMRFSVGFDLTEAVRAAIAGLPETAWERAIRADGTQREHSQVAEITGRLDLSAWPERSRLIARRTKLKAGDQQSFADCDGWRLAVFLTDQPEGDVATLDLCHRGHARIEDQIRQAKDCGLSNLPFRSFAHNQVWLWLVMLAQDLLAWTKLLCLADDAPGSSSGCATGCWTSPAGGQRRRFARPSHANACIPAAGSLTGHHR